MSPEQKQLVKTTWKKVTPMADTAAIMFYDRLFATDKSTRMLFKSTDLADQRAKLIQSLSVVVHGIDHLETLFPILVEMGRRHQEYGVIPAHYDSVGSALLWTLEQGLGPNWTPEVEAAWISAYAVLANVMRQSGSG